MKRYIFIIVLFASQFRSLAQNEYWENIDGLYGGFLLSIDKNEDEIYCAGNGGVFKSSDFGENWTNLGLNEESVSKIQIVSEHLFAISNTGCYRYVPEDSSWLNVNEGRWQSMYVMDSVIFIGSDYYGIFRSLNLGETWTEVNNGIDNKDIEEIFVISDSIVLASTSGPNGSGIFRSTNLGDNWERTDPDEYAWNFEGITEYNNILYAFDFSNYAKVYKSTDSGKTWILPLQATAPSDIIQSIYSDSTGIYVCVYHHGIFKSTNEGSNWTSLNAGLNNINVLSLSSNDSRLFAATFDGFYRSPKKNVQWVKRSKGMGNYGITSLSEIGGNLLIGTYGSGLFISKDNIFENLYLGTDLMFIKDVLVSNDLLYVLASSWPSMDVVTFLVSTDVGITWTQIDNGFDANGLERIATNNNYIYVSSNFGIFRKSIQGNLWEKLTNGIPYNINASDIACSDSVIILSNGYAEIYISTNNGDSWQPKAIQGLFSASKLLSGNSGEFYLGSDQVSVLFRSTDYGETWESLNNPHFNSSVESIFKYNNEVFVGLSYDGISIGKNEGNDWITSNYGLISKKITSFTHAGNIIYCGSDRNGIFKRSIDLTQPIPDTTIYHQNTITFKWTSSPGISQYRFQIAEDSLLTNLIYESSDLYDTSITLHSLDYNKIYYWRISSITKYWNDNFSEVQKVEIGSPLNYNLYQNYPNPFNNETTLAFEIPYKSFAELELYDILGRTVMTLLKEELGPGLHKYILNNEELASGIYIVRFRAIDYTKSIKLVLLK